MRKIILSGVVIGLFMQSAMAYSHMKHGNMQHGNMQHGNMQHGGMQHGNMQHGNMQHGNMQYGKPILESQVVVDLMHAPMMEVPFVESGNPNIDFLKNMIPHHKGAILSSQELIKNKQINPKLRKIAESIIAEQEKEIQYFNELLRNTKQFDQKLTKVEYQNFVRRAKEDMEKMMQEMSNGNASLEIAYMEAMIVHHQGAINAAKQILAITNNPIITQIANQIVSAQESEVESFYALLHSGH